MTKFQIYRLSYFSAVFVLSQPVLAQNSLDLQDATAREVAFNLMSDVEQRFSCEMQEHSMRTISKESDNRYLFMVMISIRSGTRLFPISLSSLPIQLSL